MTLKLIQDPFCVNYVIFFTFENSEGKLEAKALNVSSGNEAEMKFNTEQKYKNVQWLDDMNKRNKDREIANYNSNWEHFDTVYDRLFPSFLEYCVGPDEIRKFGKYHELWLYDVPSYDKTLHFFPRDKGVSLCKAKFRGSEHYWVNVSTLESEPNNKCPECFELFQTYKRI